MASQNRTPAVTELAKFPKFLADSGDIGGIRIERFVEGHHDPIRNCAWPFREKTAAFERKDRTPKSIEPDGNDRRFRLSRNNFVTTPEPKQRAAARKLAFRKEANNFARANLGRRVPHRIFRFARGDGNAADGAQNRMEETISIKPFIDNEPDRAWTSQEEDDRVHESDVIRQEEESARRQLFEINGGDPIKNPRDAQTKEAQDAFEAGRFCHRL